MKKIKAVVSDLDGTLLDSDKNISSENLEVIHELKKRNIKFVIASGRPIVSILLNIERWKINDFVDYIIYTNGYGIYNYALSKDTTFFPMKEEWCCEICNLYGQLNLCFLDYDGYKIHTTKINQTVKRVESYNHAKVEIVDLNYFKNHSFPKLMISGTEKEINFLETIYAKNHNNEKYHGFRSASDIFEFIDSRISKYNAIEKLMNSLQISKEEIIAFGDSANDLEMLSSLPNSIAMGNAIDSIKQVAAYVTEANDKDGIASFIRKYII